MSKTNPARGTRDFLPADIRKREYVIGIIKEVYESYGFEPLETPAVENLETLTGKYGEEGTQLMFKILKRGEKLTESLNSENPQSAIRNPQSLSDLALRYDLTVPLARVVANNKNELPKFFKRYQIQPVWRADRPAKGRFREFYQCDVDAIGSNSMVVEAELISAVNEILNKLGFDDFVIRINHRERLRQMVNDAEISPDLESDAMIALDKLDKIGEEGVLNEMLSRGIAKTSASRFLSFASGKVNAPPNDELDEITRLLSGLINLKIDPSLARGLSYYTGTIMEINVPDLAGSLGGGGRYDSLIGMFGKEQIPACGFSLGLERILVVMDERNMWGKPIAEGKLRLDSADVMVTILSEDTVAESLTLASEIRQQGLRVTVYPEPDKLGKQLKYADSINIPYVCVLGETEISEGKVTLKNMKTGNQESIFRTEAAIYVKNA